MLFYIVHNYISIDLDTFANHRKLIEHYHEKRNTSYLFIYVNIILIELDSFSFFYILYRTWMEKLKTNNNKHYILLSSYGIFALETIDFLNLLYRTTNYVHLNIFIGNIWKNKYPSQRYYLYIIIYISNFLHSFWWKIARTKMMLHFFIFIKLPNIYNMRENLTSSIFIGKCSLFKTSNCIS